MGNVTGGVGSTGTGSLGFGPGGGDGGFSGIDRRGVETLFFLYSFASVPHSGSLKLEWIHTTNCIPPFEPALMKTSLNNKRVAILAADGFEQVELQKPLNALKEAGAEVSIVSLKKGSILGMNHLDKGDEFDVDLTLDMANAEDFDALVIPGGLVNPDTLRSDVKAVDFVREFADAGKPIAAICHGPWVLIEAGIVEGRTLTSWPAIKSDIRNAGGEWVDSEVVVDQGLVTSRKPDDLKAFNAKVIEEIAEGIHSGMAMSSR